MSAHVLLNLFKELGKRDKMLGKPRRDKMLDKLCILSLFPYKFKKFNNTRA